MKYATWIKKIVIGSFALVFAVTASARKNEITLVLVPRDVPIAAHVGLDLTKNFPVLLISYQVNRDGAISLHGWTGQAWVNITPQDYRTGSFYKDGPQAALIVEKEGVPVPLSLIPSEDWCPEVYKITTVQPRPLLHLVGNFFNFKYEDWKQFAGRYRFSIDAINPDGINVAWYHKRLGEHLKVKEEVDQDDLQYWVAVRHKVVPVAEPLPAGELEPGPSTEPERDQDPFDDEIEAAVVMGAGDVPTEIIRQLEKQENLEQESVEFEPETE